MINKLIVIFFICLLLPVSNINSQPGIKDMDAVYSMDPVLYNGRRYIYHSPASAFGNQFLFNSSFFTGEANIRGFEYDSLLLNYDILNQEVLLKFKRPNKTDDVLILSEAWLQSFSFGNYYFEYFQSEDSKNKIYQVIGKDSIQIFIHWSKKLILGEGLEKGAYEYTKPERDMYIFSDGSLYKFKNNRSFISFFELNKRQYIKEYINSHSLDLRKATDNQLFELITSCNKR